MLYHVAIDPGSEIDFYASNTRNLRSLLPLWEALDGRRGTFFASRNVKSDDVKLSYVRDDLDGYAPLVVASYHDLHDVYVIGRERPFVMYEDTHNRETNGLMKIVSLFLCKDQHTYDIRRVSSNAVVKFDTSKDAAENLLSFVKGKPVIETEKINGNSAGIMYMAFGDKALQAVKRSNATLRRLGVQYPVTIVGEFSEDNLPQDYNLIPYEGQSPFDLSKAKKFQFRAGRIKPQLCRLSPYKYNLYIDADTKFIQPVHQGFELLEEYDIVLTEEKLTLEDLYNKKLAGWELNLLERDATMIELGEGSEAQKFVNSGVIFFRRNKKTFQLFADWHKEWLRFQEWDEQLALMRAVHKSKDLKVKYLPYHWNSPHLSDETIIFHDYGRGSVRV